MKLRQYQEEFIKGLASKLSKGKRKIIGQLATGGGKTVTFAGISDRYIRKNSKAVLILVHRIELLKQTRHTAYDGFQLQCEPITAGMKFIPDADIYVAMVESANRRIEKLLKKNIGLVIIDEAHRLEFMKLHEHFPKQLIIGFTATPITASKKKPMNMFYEDIVCGASIRELIADGMLCQNITWAPKDTIDRMKLQIKNGEFDDAQMALAFSKARYVHNTVTAYERWAAHTKTMIFNVNIQHSKVVAEAFVKAGYNARHLDSTMAEKERNEILYWYKTTEDAILLNVGITTTGFDEPTTQTIIINKATMSMALWIQMTGRGSRPSKGKKMFTIIDMGGNALAHGDWCDDRDWEDIFHNPPKPGKPTAAPVKNCPQCEAIIPASARQCPYCGYVYESKERNIEAELGDFVVVTKGIDVQKIIEANKNKKEYASFFAIGSKLVYEARKTIPEMNDEYATFILKKYHALGREWTKAHGKRFSRWHEIKAKEILFEKLSLEYPEWKTDIAPKLHDFGEWGVKSIQPLQNLS